MNGIGCPVCAFLPHLLTGYLVGSIPCGYLIARLRGVDIRQQGSGNIGATNVWRVLGRGWGIITFVLDFLKVPLALLLVALLLPRPGGACPRDGWRCEAAMILVFLGGVLGHNFPVWLGFKGGKGVATSAGGLLAIMPWPLLAVAAVWGFFFAIFRIVSLASMLAAVALPIAVWIFHRNDHVFLGFSLFLAAMTIWRHRANLRRLRDGTEHRWTSRKSNHPENGGASP